MQQPPQGYPPSPGYPPGQGYPQPVVTIRSNVDLDLMRSNSASQPNFSMRSQDQGQPGPGLGGMGPNGLSPGVVGMAQNGFRSEPNFGQQGSPGAFYAQTTNNNPMSYFQAHPAMYSQGEHPGGYVAANGNARFMGLVGLQGDRRASSAYTSQYPYAQSQCQQGHCQQGQCQQMGLAQQNPLYNCLLQALNNLVQARCNTENNFSSKQPDPCCPIIIRKVRNPCCPRKKCCVQPQPPCGNGTAAPANQYVSRIKTISKCCPSKPRCCLQPPSCCLCNPLSPCNLCPAPQCLSTTNPFDNQCSNVAPILLVQGAKLKCPSISSYFVNPPHQLRSGRCQTIQISDQCSERPLCITAGCKNPVPGAGAYNPVSVPVGAGRRKSSASKEKKKKKEKEKEKKKKKRKVSEVTEDEDEDDEEDESKS